MLSTASAAEAVLGCADELKAVQLLGSMQPRMVKLLHDAASLDADQAEALLAALRQELTLIQGPPGTGSSPLASLQLGLNPALCSRTGGVLLQASCQGSVGGKLCQRWRELRILGRAF